MKKNLLVAIIAVFMSLTAFAKGGIKVLNGDLSVIKNSSITATVVFDYTDLMLEGKPYMEQLKSRGSDFVRDWPSESATSEGYFIKCWNHDNDEGLQVTNASGNEYTMIFVVTEMHMGSGAASMLVGFGAGGASMSAKMYILKNNSNVPVLTVDIDGQSGRSGMTEIARRLDLYGELAEDLVKTLKKTKQSKVPASTEAITVPSMKLSGTVGTDANKAVKTNPVQTGKSKNTDAKQQSPKKTKPVADNGNQIEILKQAKGKVITSSRRPYLGDFTSLASEERIGVFLDFSKARIMGYPEEDFVQYMQSDAAGKDFDPNYPDTWENTIKPDLISIFCEIVNEELEDDFPMQFVSGTDCNYVLKLGIMDLDEDGNNVINFLFVNMKTGEVDAQIKCESDGGRVGRYTGLLKQGFESAGENFVEEFIDQIED